MIRFIISAIFILLFLPVSGQQPDMRFFRAKTLLEQKQSDAAIGLLLGDKPGIHVYSLLGKGYFQKNDYAKAIKYFLLADSIQKNSASLDLARSYAKLNDVKNAIVWLQRYLASPEKLPEIEIFTDHAFDELLNAKEWGILWEKSWYSESEVEKNAIHAMITKGNVSAAQDEMDRYRERIYPRHSALALQALIYEKQKMNEPAMSSINQAIEQTSRSDEYFALRASLFYNSARYREALEDISKAIKLNLYQPGYYLLRIQSARMAGNLELAESDVKVYQQLYPDLSETYHQLGLLENAKGHYHNALEYYNQLLQKEQGNAQFFIERGINELALNRNTSADEDFGMALDLNPTLLEAYLKKGQTQLLLGDTLGACHCLTKAKQLGSKDAAKLLYENCK